MNRRLALAYAWGKWFAIAAEEFQRIEKRAKALRPRGNWAILVEDDEVALQYQRVVFRIRRAKRAVGAWGVCGYGELGVEDGQFAVGWASKEKLAQMNFDSFHKERLRAKRAKELAEDKRHPRQVLDE